MVEGEDEVGGTLLIGMLHSVGWYGFWGLEVEVFFMVHVLEGFHGEGEGN